MDAHTHLSFESSLDWKQDQLDGLKKPITEQAIDATEYARRTLLAGFTTVRDLGSSDLIDVGLRNAINAGKVPGPRMLVAVNAIGARGGHCDPTGGFRPDLLKEPGPEQGVANGPDEIRAAVRFDTKHGADVIKTCATGGVLSEADKVDSPQLTQAELDALVDEAHALGRKTAAHAHGAEGAKRAIRAGIDSIEHGSFLDDEAFELMRKKGTYFVPTPLPCIMERLREARGAGAHHREGGERGRPRAGDAEARHRQERPDRLRQRRRGVPARNAAEPVRDLRPRRDEAAGGHPYRDLRRRSAARGPRPGHGRDQEAGGCGGGPGRSRRATSR